VNELPDINYLIFFRDAMLLPNTKAANGDERFKKWLQRANREDGSQLIQPTYGGILDMLKQSGHFTWVVERPILSAYYNIKWYTMCIL